MDTVDKAEKASMDLQPRKGMGGIWDRLAGPGATKAENWVNITWVLLFTTGALAYPLLSHLNWSVFQFLLVGLIAFDIAGGISVNASPSAKRWWHRPGQGFRQHFSFVAFHIHPFLLAALFHDFSWIAAGSMYGSVLLAAVLILLTPLDIRRPVAFILYAILILVGTYLVPVPAGLAWFFPFLALKLLLAHLLPEQPLQHT